MNGKPPREYILESKFHLQIALQKLHHTINSLEKEEKELRFEEHELSENTYLSLDIYIKVLKDIEEEIFQALNKNDFFFKSMK